MRQVAAWQQNYATKQKWLSFSELYTKECCTESMLKYRSSIHSTTGLECITTKAWAVGYLLPLTFSSHQCKNTTSAKNHNIRADQLTIVNKAGANTVPCSTKIFHQSSKFLTFMICKQYSSIVNCKYHYALKLLGDCSQNQDVSYQRNQSCCIMIDTAVKLWTYYKNA